MVWEEILSLDLADTDLAFPIITVGEQAIFTLSTKKDEMENGYKKALSYVIWKPDGTSYDNGQREPYDSLSLRMTTDLQSKKEQLHYGG